MSKEEQAERIVDLIFHELAMRAGFDHWWGEVHRETRKEVINDLVDLVGKELDKDE